MKRVKSPLSLNRDTIRRLAGAELSQAVGGVNSGSQPGISVTCPPPKNGEGAGCVTGLA